jgi:hypothetical protein
MPKSGPEKVVKLKRQWKTREQKLLRALRSAETALWKCGENAEARKIERLFRELGIKVTRK